MFTVEERDRVREHVLELARVDPRVVAGAEVGSLAAGSGDRWSDLDLTFGVADGETVDDVLADWTGRIVDELNGVHLFDLPSGATIYRIFLLPGTLQLDVSFTPAAAFRGRRPEVAAARRPGRPRPRSRAQLGERDRGDVVDEASSSST